MEEFSPLIVWLQGTGDQIVTYLSNPWALYQFAIAAGCFLLALPVSHFLTPVAEARAREIKGHPGLLRLIIAFMRRIKWMAFIAFLLVAREVVQAFTWTSRSYLLSLILTLATAWFVITVLSRIIRNRSVAQIVAFTIWVLVAIRILGVTQEVIAFLDSAAIPIGSFRLSLLFVIKVVAITATLFALASFFGNFADDRIHRVDGISPSLKVLLGKLIKIVLLILAGAIALAATGIDLTALTVFSGAVGVGIGFGLQKVVSNFISGIIILVDKSIKPGDAIQLGETFGWIRELRARFVSVVTRDGREYLIPNEDFVTQQVVNWSYSDDYVRLDVDFGVSYDSDPHEVTCIAIEAAKTVGRVHAHKAPVCWMTAFGASSLDFKLRFWIANPRDGLTNVRGQALLALWDAFKEAGIGIPFPHREVMFKGDALRVEVAEAPASAKPRKSATSNAVQD